MKHLFENHDLATERCGQFIDITDDVLTAVSKSEVENGTVVVYSPHTTCAVVINEPESGFMDDFCELLDELAPTRPLLPPRRPRDPDRRDRRGHGRLPERPFAPAGGAALVDIAGDPDRRRAGRCSAAGRRSSSASSTAPGPARSSSRSRGTDGRERARRRGRGGRFAVRHRRPRRTSSPRPRARTSPSRCGSCRRGVRRQLEAIYGFARLVDDAGDLHEGDRGALLDWIEADLDRAFAGRAEHPLLQRVSALVARALASARAVPAADRGEPPGSGGRRATRRGTSSPAYCELSANPVGELVLHVFGAATPERIRWSDAVCTGLQLAEHWQDVGEDYGRGRIYLPQEDMAALRCRRGRHRRGARRASAFRALLAFEVSAPAGCSTRGCRSSARSPGATGSPSPPTSAAGGRRSTRSSAPGFDVLRRIPRAGGRARASPRRCACCGRRA